MLTKKQDTKLRQQLKQRILDCFDPKRITRKRDFRNWVKERIEDYMYALYEEERELGTSDYDELVKMVDSFNWECGEEESFDEYLEKLTA